MNVKRWDKKRVCSCCSTTNQAERQRKSINSGKQGIGVGTTDGST